MILLFLPHTVSQNNEPNFLPNGFSYFHVFAAISDECEAIANRHQKKWVPNFWRTRWFRFDLCQNAKKIISAQNQQPWDTFLTSGFETASCFYHVYRNMRITQANRRKIRANIHLNCATRHTQSLVCSVSYLVMSHGNINHKTMPDNAFSLIPQVPFAIFVRNQSYNLFGECGNVSPALTAVEIDGIL